MGELEGINAIIYVLLKCATHYLRYTHTIVLATLVSTWFVHLLNCT